MMRLLFAGALLLAGLFYFLLSGSDSETGAGARQEVVSPEQPGPGGRVAELASEGIARPLRMRSAGTGPSAADTQQTSTMPVDKIQASLGDAFASEEPSKGPVARERETLIRGVIAGLVDAEVGDAQISSLECRTQHCSVQLEGKDSEALIQLVDALQDDRGFLGKCESLMLAREGEAIIVYLRFL